MTVTQADALPHDHRQDRRARARRAHLWLGLCLVLTCAISLETGASGVSLWSVMSAGAADTPVQGIILWEVRLPRVLLGVLVGAALAVSGTVMQGLFRNPLADPGIVGVSAGAGLGAVTAIVLGSLLPIALRDSLGPFLVPVAAFLGGWASVLLLYGVATRGGRTSVATMLLAGIALGALSGAVSGLMVYAADDQQLRDLTFWGLGSLAGATWAKVATAAPILLMAMAGAMTLGRGLNGLAFGEATALHLGIPVQRVKTLAILAVAAATGGAVAVSGGIGFIGIVVPHLLRLATGPDHGPLLVNAALLGASLLLGADIVSRVIIAPAELPIGIVTAVVGAPVFLWILLRQRPMGDF
ncbi:iron ABC transporter permease [uncultured Roseovarius sp.]|uniref:FecCD family ABC transporter permease n=1 Tax=uncultured Roseovarius sp. TaxID=293344 RepID=UPI000C68D97A|nr:iron ABC transporter [Roseovarius sp.]MBD12115.1 iron ABC transporter [Roseovarius sp.]|tara:strand:- start:529 stop:1596 length:1068 start_codon:yes stop_codon:yes gene_type:complete